jgi:predicted Zn-dependent peptidase
MPSTRHALRTHAKPLLATLPNGVRMVALPLPHALTSNVSVFVRCGSAHETRRSSGIGHVIEHMVFKGTHGRDARRINLDAERLGTEVNAHTDKDHSAFHMRGHAADTARFIALLADITLNPSFPEAEFVNERQVLLQEFAEDEDDPASTAFKLFDRACWDTQPAAMPVIGSRRSIEGLTREDLLAHHAQHYSAANLVVAVAGPIDVDAVWREVARSFAHLPRSSANTLPAPSYGGGEVKRLQLRAQPGSSQAQVVLGYPIAGLQQQDATAEVAAAVLGEGMSSPLMQRLREELGLVYFAACSADVLDGFGQFVIEAAMAAEQLQAFLAETAQLLVRQAARSQSAELARAHKQLAVRQLAMMERPHRWLEQAALDVFVLGKPRSQAAWAEQIAAVSTRQLRAAFAQMVEQPLALAMCGRLPRGTRAATQATLAAAGLR